MDKSDWKSPEHKVPELKESPELFVDDSPMELTTTADEVSTADENRELPASSADLSSIDLSSPNLSRAGQRPAFNNLTTYMLENESQIFWLCASALMVVIGVWFHDVHGRFFWNAQISNFCQVLTLLSPLCALAVLFSKPNKFERPLLALGAFVSLLFWNQVATVSCLIVMPFRFKGANRAVGRAILLGLQTAVIFFSPLFSDVVQVEDRLKNDTYDLFLCQHKTPFKAVTFTLEEHVPIGPFFYFGKVHWRMVDTREPKSLSIVPIDDSHVAVLVNRFSHYHRSEIDLTKKNVPIKFEKIEGER